MIDKYSPENIEFETVRTRRLRRIIITAIVVIVLLILNIFVIGNFLRLVF